MAIPDGWLIEPITPAEVEDDLAVEGPSDPWLLRWRALLGQRAPGDELWTYAGYEGGADDGFSELRWGFALVRDGAVVDWIDASW